MIESIEIADIATYGSRPEFLRDLSQFNYVFGLNGTGKTTIARVIAEEVGSRVGQSTAEQAVGSRQCKLLICQYYPST